VTWYARGFYDRAAQCLVTASDLAPDNPTPYLFLGKMQSVLTFPTEGVAERLARFAQLQPENAPANYYYAVSLWKQSAGAADSSTEISARVESLLLKAVQLDPKFGAAYLQLGILYSRHGEFPRAIPAYQKAIAVSPESDDIAEEAHYRLSQAYQRIGDKINAKLELEFHNQLDKKTKEQIESERRSIQEFVISLQQKDPTPQPQP
jgi:tetratricopeptide (TPR) repeat protein